MKGRSTGSASFPETDDRVFDIISECFICACIEWLLIDFICSELCVMCDVLTSVVKLVLCLYIKPSSFVNRQLIDKECCNDRWRPMLLMHFHALSLHLLCASQHCWLNSSMKIAPHFMRSGAHCIFCHNFIICKLIFMTLSHCVCLIISLWCDPHLFILQNIQCRG